MKAVINDNSVEYLRKICDRRMQEYYPAGIPNVVLEGLERELQCAGKTDSIDAWRIYYEFNEMANKNQSLITVRGTINNSFLTFLLGKTPLDPMEAYYYCPSCGHYEKITACAFGIEADEKACPECGSNMDRRGYSLHEVFAWGNSDTPKDVDFTYDYPKCLREFLRTTLQRLYPESEIIECMTQIFDNGSVTKEMGGYAILPAGTKADTDFLQLLSYKEDGKVVFEGNHFDYEQRDILYISAYESDILNAIMKMQEETGIYYYEVKTDVENRYVTRALINTNLLSEEEEIALSFEDEAGLFQLTELFAIAHNTYSIFENDEPDDIDQIYASVLRDDMYELSLAERFFTRETLYERLLAYGLSEHDAFICTEFVRKGNVQQNDRWQEIVERYNIPKEVADFCKGYRYMWIRAYGLIRQYLLSICAEYQKKDPALYMKSAPA